MRSDELADRQIEVWQQLREAPLYFDACWDWYQRLSEDQQDWVTYVVDAFTSWGESAVERCAARLPGDEAIYCS